MRVCECVRVCVCVYVCVFDCLYSRLLSNPLGLFQHVRPMFTGYMFTKNSKVFFVIYSCSHFGCSVFHFGVFFGPAWAVILRSKPFL